MKHLTTQAQTPRASEDRITTETQSRGCLERLVRPLVSTDTPLSREQKRYKRQLYGTCFSPISNLVWWRDLVRVILDPNGSNPPYRVSRLTAIVFHLDPAAYYVWPHPRIPECGCETIGTFLARILVSACNRGLKSRAIPDYDTKASGKIHGEAAAALQADLNWRRMMFLSYGDNWPNDQSERPDPKCEIGHKATPGSL